MIGTLQTNSGLTDLTLEKNTIKLKLPSCMVYRRRRLLSYFIWTVYDTSKGKAFRIRSVRVPTGQILIPCIDKGSSQMVGIALVVRRDQGFELKVCAPPRRYLASHEAPGTRWAANWCTRSRHTRSEGGRPREAGIPSQVVYRETNSIAGLSFYDPPS